ncbi:MAG: FecR domain-containing protein, partial [Rhodospirillales bacterium]|nr:FecR domain-containing protein [Rhodospirillales bacterium]
MVTGPEGQTLLIRQYFTLENPPDLMTADGVVLRGDLAVRLAGPLTPGQYAQAGPTAAKEPIGHVETTSGGTEVVRVDGTRVTLQQGDPLFLGDILETGADGAVGIVFADESTLSLGESGRMTLDEMVYDPGEQSGTMSVSLLQGAFSFVSGQIAKTDPNAMTLNTPTATIGIRGTAGGGRVDAAGVTTAVLLPEAAGFTGEMSIGNATGVQTINQPGQAINIASINAAPSPPFVLTPQQMGQAFGGALAALPNAAQVVSQNVVSGAKQGLEQQQVAKDAAVKAEAAK